MAESLQDLLERHHGDLIDEWSGVEGVNEDVLPKGRLKEVLSQILVGLRQALASHGALAHDEELSAAVETLVRARSGAGASPIDNARLVMALKRPLLERLRRSIDSRSGSMSTADLVDELLQVDDVADQLGLMALKVHISHQAEVIAQQREEMEELSAPVIRLWDGILALPIIGTLDSLRTQRMMETLLEEVRRVDAEVVVLDVSAVPVIDTATAQHLVRSTRAVRMMGADCIISGVRPQIAQTMVTLGIDLGEVETRSSVASALQAAFEKRGFLLEKRSG